MTDIKLQDKLAALLCEWKDTRLYNEIAKRILETVELNRKDTEARLDPCRGVVQAYADYSPTDGGIELLAAIDKWLAVSDCISWESLVMPDNIKDMLKQEAKTCRTCKYRGRELLLEDDEDFGPDKPTGFFFCKKVTLVENKRGLVKGQKFAAMNSSGYFAALCVEEDFGCVDWEKNNDTL